jgi:hypothetical protein
LSIKTKDRDFRIRSPLKAVGNILSTIGNLSATVSNLSKVIPVLATKPKLKRQTGISSKKGDFSIAAQEVRASSQGAHTTSTAGMSDIPTHKKVKSLTSQEAAPTNLRAGKLSPMRDIHTLTAGRNRNAGPPAKDPHRQEEHRGQ